MAKTVRLRIADLRDHVDRLCKQYDIQPCPCNRQDHDENSAGVFWVQVAPGQYKIKSHLMQVVDERTYAIALHEIGHVAHPQGMTRMNNKQQVTGDTMRAEEQAAWSWAQQNAIAWTVRMQAVKDAAYRTYTDPKLKHGTIFDLLARLGSKP